MCGIAGLWSHGDDVAREARAMADALRHRGPDDAGVWSDADAGLALSHRRLSIIDLSSAGHQPMLSAGGRWVLSYNGEIYNHLELRRELDGNAPLVWRGTSDTETLVAGIERWGLEATLQRAVGMFALALWDRETRTLALARDRMGEKPLFYGWSGARIVFGSELKAVYALTGFERKVDPSALERYLRHNYVPAPQSILRGIFKVEPGVVVRLAEEALLNPPQVAPSAESPAGHGVECRRYWSLAATVTAPQDALTANEAVDRLKTCLETAVRDQLMADVPVGAFLSGGVDSSAVVALMTQVASTKVRTFTIGFAESGMDEAPYAKAVAAHLGTDHHELYVTPAHALALVPDLPRVYDEPFGDSSQIPTTLLSRFTRESVTVALSGDAGDELFCGYNRYLVSRRLWERAARIPAPIRAAMGSALGAVPTGLADAVGQLPMVPSIPMLGNKLHKLGRMLKTSMGVDAIYRAASEEWQGCPPMATDTQFRASVLPTIAATPEEWMMHWDASTYLPDDILVKVDRASMAASLETRVPFLDHRVVEQAWRTPLEYKKRDGQGKWMLRQILYAHVPRELIERPKAGFAVPIGSWLRGPLREWADGFLSHAALSRQSMLDAGAIGRRWQQHLAGTHDWTGSLWGVLMFRAWAAEWNVEC